MYFKIVIILIVFTQWPGYYTQSIFPKIENNRLLATQGKLLETQGKLLATQGNLRNVSYLEYDKKLLGEVLGQNIAHLPPALRTNQTLEEHSKMLQGIHTLYGGDRTPALSALMGPIQARIRNISESLVQPIDRIRLPNVSSNIISLLFDIVNALGREKRIQIKYSRNIDIFTT